MHYSFGTGQQHVALLGKKAISKWFLVPFGLAAHDVNIYAYVRGDTLAKNDPFDATGRPDINPGEFDGWNFHLRGRDCGCNWRPGFDLLRQQFGFW